MTTFRNHLDTARSKEQLESKIMMAELSEQTLTRDGKLFIPVSMCCWRKKVKAD
jgi:hypothetical protein